MDDATDALFAAALAARANAHAPYSRFPVGAAVLAASGRIFAGCNVENAAYPVGTCAEAGALAAMVAGGERRFAAALVVAERPITPCGACRQRLAEFGAAGVTVYAAGPEGVRRSYTLGALLPEAFAL